jgi:hypothetical protein
MRAGSDPHEKLPGEDLVEVRFRRLVHEEFVRVKVIFSRFVDDADEAVLGGEFVLDHAVELSQLQRRGVVVVAYADREVLFTGA